MVCATSLASCYRLVWGTCYSVAACHSPAGVVEVRTAAALGATAVAAVAEVLVGGRALRLVGSHTGHPAESGPGIAPTYCLKDNHPCRIVDLKPAMSF